MAGIFIDPNDRVAVTDGENTIWIKAKMDEATRAAVHDEIGARGLIGENVDMEDAQVQGLGSYRLALLIHNVVGWSGPLFEEVDKKGRKKPIPCNRFWIRRLDPDNPLTIKARERISELNTTAESPDPNDLDASGSMIAGA